MNKDTLLALKFVWKHKSLTHTFSDAKNKRKKITHSHVIWKRKNWDTNTSLSNNLTRCTRSSCVCSIERSDRRNRNEKDFES